MRERYDVVIVGSGHGGSHTAIALRQQQYGGSIAMIGEEPDLPYERPPLTKDYLSGEKPFHRILIRPPEFWAEKNVQVLTGFRAAVIDPDARSIADSTGRQILYRKMVWAAGGRARSLTCSGHDLTGIYTVRTRADADRISRELGTTEQIIVVGGGYIGLETAAVLTKLGKHVTLIETQDRVLSRVAGNLLSRFFEVEHRCRGVDIRLNSVVQHVEGANGRAIGVRLLDGTFIPGQMIIVGIGIIPNVEPLLAAGASGGNGVMVDATCRTTLEDIYAVGDCALHASDFAGGARIRLESVQNATDMAAVVAKVMAGKTEAYCSVPWFWSSQFDLRLQTVGLSSGHDQEVLRGDPVNRAFSIIYLKDGRVIAMDCVNSSRDFVQGRSLVMTRAHVNQRELANSETPLKSLILHSPLN